MMNPFTTNQNKSRANQFTKTTLAQTTCRLRSGLIDPNKSPLATGMAGARCNRADSPLSEAESGANKKPPDIA